MSGVAPSGRRGRRGTAGATGATGAQGPSCLPWAIGVAPDISAAAPSSWTSYGGGAAVTVGSGDSAGIVINPTGAVAVGTASIGVSRATPNRPWTWAVLVGLGTAGYGRCCVVLDQVNDEWCWSSNGATWGVYKEVAGSYVLQSSTITPLDASGLWFGVRVETSASGAQTHTWSYGWGPVSGAGRYAAIDFHSASVNSTGLVHAAASAFRSFIPREYRSW